MKRINKLFLIVIATVMFVSCVDEYKSDFLPEKKGEVVRSEFMNSYEVLKNYITDPNFKLGSGIVAADFLKKETIYSLTCSNFNEITPSDAMMHGATVSADGSMNFTTVKNLIETAQEVGLSLFGHALCSHSNQQKTFLNRLIADIIIPGEFSSGIVRIKDFESNKLDDEFLMTGNGFGKVVTDPKGKKGNVLNIGGPASNSFPKIEISLSEGKTLGDFSKLTFDFNGAGSGGLYGSGVRLAINDASKLTQYGTPASFGCPNGDWGTISLELSKLNLTVEQKALTNFTLIVGSGTGSGMYYIDNISLYWEHNVPGQTIVKTPEEKKQILSDTLRTWISGMMVACESRVTAWDVINEPMSDNDNYMLRSGANETNTADKFYWADYLGDNYARDVVKYTRQSFKQSGGTDSDLKLFVNEYGLELNGNSKCKRLLTMIQQWEQDGTKIDGVGTQMHLSYSLDPIKQAENEKDIVSMFKLLATTGKLIKISALDMILADETGETIKNSNITLEQQVLMSGYYSFIIHKYLDNVPANQRYGITHKGSVGGVNGEYIGLWDKYYNRKFTYTGFADGLTNKE